MAIEKAYRCLYCNCPTIRQRDEVEFKLITPLDIAPREALELINAKEYKYIHHQLCDSKCYNLKVVDNAINGLSFALLNPEDHFLPLNLDKDIEKAENSLFKLKEFK
ncbi:hypothetical protein QUF94_14585 [Peribacillus sp. NJ4]|uniref:hypothetical protein n=1 Tax=Peribacillus sp. NJ4 TaxID=3055862 RepID=UPI0025A2D275|nr:hypothetical protein [Peribacillus sp. NJ4]MDM5212652.1 hypothetical protein [Peribacillus sp. NJ4]